MRQFAPYPIYINDADRWEDVRQRQIGEFAAKRDAKMVNWLKGTAKQLYEITEDIRKAAEGLLAPEQKTQVLGHAEVRKVFKVSKVGTIAGCFITDGVVERDALIRVTRNGIVIENNRKLEQLKRVKDDAKEVRAGLAEYKQTLAKAEEPALADLERLAQRAYSRELRPEEAKSLRGLYQRLRSASQSLNSGRKFAQLSPGDQHDFVDAMRQNKVQG